MKVALMIYAALYLLATFASVAYDIKDKKPRLGYGIRYDPAPFGIGWDPLVCE
jgi:hypothetical protein